MDSLQKVVSAHPIPVAVAALCSAMVVRRINQDYQAWLNLGPGGVPYNILGYLIATRASFSASTDLKETVCYDSLISSPGHLSDIPLREGAPPVISKWVVPVRQLNSRASKTRIEQIDAMIYKIAAEHDLIFAAPSVYEGGYSPGLFIQASHGEEKEVQKSSKKREIFHLHDSEGSAHCVLSPADAKYVLDAGWGERHPMSGQIGIPLTYVMIYSPRSDAELEVMRKIALAAVEYALERQGRGEL